MWYLSTGHGCAEPLPAGPEGAGLRASAPSPSVPLPVLFVGALLMELHATIATAPTAGKWAWPPPLLQPTARTKCLLAAQPRPWLRSGCSRRSPRSMRSCLRDGMWQPRHQTCAGKAAWSLEHSHALQVEAALGPDPEAEGEQGPRKAYESRQPWGPFAGVRPLPGC